MLNSFSEMRLGQIWGKNRGRAVRLMKEGGWIVAGTVLTTLGQLVLVRVLTEYLDRTEYGKLALAMTAGTLVGQVIMGFQVGVGRYFPIALEEKLLPEYRKAVQRLFVYAAIAVATVTLIAGVVLKEWCGILLAAAGFAFFSGWNGVYNSLQTAARQRATVAFHTSLDAWLKIGLAVGAIHLLGAASTPVILGYTLSAFCTGISQCFCFRRFLDSQPTAAKFNPPSVWIKKIMSFSWPFSAWGMFTWMQQSSDRLALEKFTSTEIVGEYAVLLQLGYAPVAASTGILVTFLYPILYQRAGGGMNLENMGKANLLAWQTVWLVLGLTVLGFVLTLLTHPWIFKVLVGEEYRSVSYLLPWLVFAGGLFAAGQTFALQIMTEMATLRLLRVKIVTAILGAGANLAGAWLFGLAGVVGGIVAFSGLYLIAIIFSLHTKNRLKQLPSDETDH